ARLPASSPSRWLLSTCYEAEAPPCCKGQRRLRSLNSRPEVTTAVAALRKRRKGERSSLDLAMGVNTVADTDSGGWRFDGDGLIVLRDEERPRRVGLVALDDAADDDGGVELVVTLADADAHLGIRRRSGVRAEQHADQPGVYLASDLPA